MEGCPLAEGHGRLMGGGVVAVPQTSHGCPAARIGKGHDDGESGVQRVQKIQSLLTARCVSYQWSKNNEERDPRGGVSQRLGWSWLDGGGPSIDVCGTPKPWGAAVNRTGRTGKRDQIKQETEQ